MHSTGSGCGIR